MCGESCLVLLRIKHKAKTWIKTGQGWGNTSKKCTCAVLPEDFPTRDSHREKARCREELPQGYGMWKMLTSVKSEVHRATEGWKTRLWGKNEVLTDWEFSVQTRVSTWKCWRSSCWALGHAGSLRRWCWMQNSLEGNVRWLWGKRAQLWKRKVTDKVA